MQQPGKTWSTHDPNEPGQDHDLSEPERDPVFFLQMWFFSYTFFLSWLLTLFKVHYINIKNILCFFNVGFETLYYIYSMFLRKKLLISSI